MSNYIRMFMVLWCCFFAAWALFEILHNEERGPSWIDVFNIIVQPIGAFGNLYNIVSE